MLTPETATAYVLQYALANWSDGAIHAVTPNTDCVELAFDVHVSVRWDDLSDPTLEVMTVRAQADGSLSGEMVK